MKRLIQALFVVTTLAALYGCGGSSTSTVPPSVTTPELTGTVASGAPVPLGTQVTVKDANGVTKSTTTVDANGLYKIPVGDLTPPFVICVDTTTPPPTNPCAAGSGTSDKVIMSVANQAGTANVTPLTKLAAANAAGVTDPTTLFNSLTTLRALTASNISQGMAAITAVVGDYLRAAGIDPTQFNPLTTPFTPNGTGADSVLDIVKPKLDSTGKVNISFKGYTSNKPSFDISKPFAQYSTAMRNSMKNAFGNVGGQISPSAGVSPIIPDNVTLPPGFVIPANVRIPSGVQIPPGVTIPAGVTFDPSVRIDNSITLPVGVTAPHVGAVDIPPYAIIPSGVTLPNGITIPAGVTLPAGFTIPSGANVPASWSTSAPAGVTVPNNAQFGAPAPTQGSCDTGYVSAPMLPAVPGLTAACTNITFCSKQTGGYLVSGIST